MDLLAHLNEQQREAVTATEGHIRVIAGAGSGKTRTIAHRYAYLIQELGISPSSILCLTFTNKAAREMKNRIKHLLGGDFDTSFVATIHSYCTRILREDIGRLFYPESFVVLDVNDQKKILEEVYDELGIKMDTASFEYIIEQLKYYKNVLHYCDFVLKPDQDIAEVEPKSLQERVLLRYIQKQKKYFGLDFFDLINFVIYLFNNHADILKKWQQRIHYVMVDEFQDITNKEFKLIRRLTELNRNFYIVGDPDQNIYEWRGSSMDVLLQFGQKLESLYKEPIEVRDIYLNQNYRSTPEILAAANSLIDKNVMRLKKSLETHYQSGAPVIHFHGKNEAAEMMHIINGINAHVQGGGHYNDIAVLYRSTYVSRFVEQYFLKQNVPYVVYGGVGFYERMEIKDVLSYLRLVAHGDDLSFLRVCNVPRRKMGKMKIEALKHHAETANTTLYEALQAHIDDPIFRNSGARYFLDTIETLRAKSAELPVSELLQRLMIDTGYELYIRESGDMERLDNISELIRSIVQTETEYGEPLPLPVFLQDVTLHRDLEEDASKDTVRIMTAHLAKGLEFPIVYVVGLNEGVFPSARALEERKEQALEEERRLCFVACTRARQRLTLTESEGVGIKGLSKTPSRFLFDIDDSAITREGEIPDELIQEMRLRSNPSPVTGGPRFREGDHVKHKVFGEGVVEEVDIDCLQYQIRFLNGIKPIHFGYQGLTDRE